MIRIAFGDSVAMPFLSLVRFAGQGTVVVSRPEWDSRQMDVHQSSQFFNPLFFWGGGVVLLGDMPRYR